MCIGLIHFTLKYRSNNLSRSCKFNWYHIAYFIYKMHTNRQYLWMNETWCKVGPRPCNGNNKDFFGLCWQRYSCPAVTDMQMLRPWLSGTNHWQHWLMTALSSLFLPLFCLFFLFPMHTYVHVKVVKEFTLIYPAWCLMLSRLLLLTLALSDASCCCNQCKAYCSQAQLQ